MEYVPINFRRGIQIPLYKGMNTSTLSVDNYRGITLLSTYNKLFEVILWDRIKGWWEDTGVIAQTQGACRPGTSCLHTAMLLQETIASQLEVNPKVFVAYIDVAKAFDSVWVDGLFSQLYDLGIRGRTWRILYKTYSDFRCRVRIYDKVSEWYTMGCGIHQGGYLSLIKYVSFINSLLIHLNESNFGCEIHGLKVSPTGYADDVASASPSKRKVDAVLDAVFKHSRKWRYEFNAKKSAILVYGESKKDRNCIKDLRVYRLGNDIIKERKIMIMLVSRL